MNQNSLKAEKIEKSVDFKGRIDPQLKVDFSTPYICDFQISGNKITKKKGFDSYYSQVMLNEPVPKEGKFTFKWKITKSYYKESSSIFFGITPVEFKNYRTSHFN